MGGEKSLSVSSVWSRTGSPPHGRGKESEYLLIATELRITPAWAGKSSSSISLALFHEDHPRMGGEKTLPSIRG